MIPLALSMFSGLATGPALEMDTLTLQQAAALDGHLVRATLTLVNPPDIVGWWAILGDDRGALTRTVVVPKGLKLNGGDVVRVVGALEVIHHPAAAVNGVNVPAWEEVRVTGWRVR